VRDTKNQLADAFHATVTPEAFVVDGEGQLVYHGRIDDQYAVGQRKEAPTKRELVSALDDVLAGRPVAVDAVAAAGCTIIRERGPQPETGRLTYTRDVAPIVQEKCQGCHRPGHVGPMSLMTYDDVVSWSDNIHARVKARIMPPWGANNHFGAFRNNRGLSDEQYATILSWIDEGSPLGDPKDMPPPRQFKDGWGIANPDIVVPVAEAIHVPATGTFPYQYVWVDHDFTEDTWVNEAELRSTTPTVAHHIIAMVVYPEELPKGKLPKLTARTMGRNLAGLAIGGDPAIDWGAGFAKKIPKGSKLYFEIHYTPNGTAQVDRPIIGLKTIKNPKSEVITGLATSRKIHIPPFQDDYEVVSEFEFKEAGRILAMAPHMHKRGKDFRFDLTYPDGRTETVLDVTRYDFNMPTNYFPTEPIVAPQGTKVRCTAHYDNSERNVINPDPTATVEVGPQTDDEMMIGFIDLAYDLPIGDKRVLALNPAAETDQ
jgi:hypothetical protein